MSEEVKVPVPAPKKHKVKAHPRKHSWIPSYLRRNPTKSHPPARRVILPTDPSHPEPSRKGVEATYSAQFVRKNPEVLEGINPPSSRFTQVDRTENWLRFRLADPEDFIGATFRTIKTDKDTREVRAINRRRKRWETQSIMKRRPEFDEEVSAHDTE